jgi:hypothetical protein
MKIIVAHPGKQHSYKTAEALYTNNILCQYITTVYNKPSKISKLINAFFPAAIKKKYNQRRSDILPDSIVDTQCTLLGLILLYIYKLPINKKIIDFFYKKVEDRFGLKVAKIAIKMNVDAVIMYDTTCNVCFKYLKEKAPQIKRIQDVSIANRLFMKDNYLNDIIKTKQEELRQEQIHLWDEKNITRYEEEINLTQYFIVASQMSKRSIIYTTKQEKNIYVIPYGVKNQLFHCSSEKEIHIPPLKLIYVGLICYRKGLHHLLPLISQKFKNTVELTLVGYYPSNSLLYKKYHNFPNIKFTGPISHEELYKYYQNADVFVFPTLGEGYGLVILEALSCGIPCIVSNLAGGDDAIENGKNGFVFEGGNDSDLTNKIQWFIDHPSKIKEMSIYCKNTAKQYTWDKYSQNLYNTIKTIIEH